MKNNIGLLLKVQLQSRFGINEALHSGDTKKKRKLVLFGFLFLLLGLMIIFYTAAVAVALCVVGASEAVPAYALSVTSLIVFCFSVFKAGSMIFQLSSYEMLISLPIKPADIVTSRFLNMYLEDLLLSVLTMIPSSIVYGYFMKPSVWFYIVTVICTIFVPLFPMVIATAIGSLFIAVGARMKHKNAIVNLCSILFLVAVMIASFLPTAAGPDLGAKQIANVAQMMTETVNKMYFLAPLYSSALLQKDILALLVFLLLAIGVFLIYVGIVQAKFQAICSALQNHVSKGNYRITQLQTNSPVKALYQKEIKKFFSSNVYLMNAGVGYMLMILFAGATVIIGPEKMEETLGMPGILKAFYPTVLAWFVSLSPSSASAISIEGKQWWIPLTLPITNRQLLNSKILVNLTFSVPSSILCGLLAAIAFHEDLGYSVCLIITPLVYSFFSAVLGIIINAKFPVFNWKNEVNVVKQSTSVGICMLISFLIVGVPIALLIVSGGRFDNLVMYGIDFVLGLLTIVLYARIDHINLQNL